MAAEQSLESIAMASAQDLTTSVHDSYPDMINTKACNQVTITSFSNDKKTEVP